MTSSSCYAWVEPYTTLDTSAGKLWCLSYMNGSGPFKLDVSWKSLVDPERPTSLSLRHISVYWQKEWQTFSTYLRSRTTS
eukprot:14625800-Heterocapsa_arctica.AAC.1